MHFRWIFVWTLKQSEFIPHCPVASAGDEWSEAALDDFDRLTHSARWKPLQAKLCSYSHSDDSSWPSVKLYDTIQGKVSEKRWSSAFSRLVSHSRCLAQTVDIGEELIQLGHAVDFQEAVNGKADGDNLGSLQRMLVSHLLYLPCECWSLVSKIGEKHSHYNLFAFHTFPFFSLDSSLAAMQHYSCPNTFLQLSESILTVNKCRLSPAICPE